MSIQPEDDSAIERRREALQAALDIYRDARARSTTISAAALSAVGVFTLLVGFAGPQQLRDLGAAAIPVVLLVGVGLVTALTVLLRTPVMVPFRSDAFIDKGFVEADHVEVLGGMVATVVAAERYTRATNGKAAFLVNVSLSALVAALVTLVFELGLGPRRGLIAGASSAAVVVGAAWLLRRVIFWPSTRT